MNSRGPRSRIPDEEEARKWQKIPFRIVHVSSEDEEYSVRELLNRTPFSRGWLSSRFCNYPQELLIEFPKPIKMREIQFLSHQYSIATKIEIFILPPQSEKFKKIGYLSLDSNERSNFQARELKTVYTDYFCIRVKFNLLRCHNNSHNIYNQVGLIAISVLGEFPNINTMNDKNANIENMEKLEDEMMYDPATLKRLKELYRAKKKAVELEDFDEAKRIKVAIDSLKSVSQSLIQLEERKKIAIKNDDFDAAKLIKYEIDRLRNAVAGANINETNRKIAREQNMMNNMNNNPLQLPPGYPNTGDKTRMFNTGNQKDYQPINNEYEMENDEDIYRIRNNINQGYQLEDPEKLNRINEMQNNINQEPQNQIQNQNQNNQIKDTSDPFNQGSKGVIDVDNQKVGGIGLNFSEMVEAQLKKAGLGGGANAEEGISDEQLNAEAYKFAEPLIPVLTFPLIKLLFAQQWKNKESGFQQLNKEINDYPNSMVFGSKSPEEIVVACLGACAYVLRSNISQALLAAMDLINNLFNKFSNIKPEGLTKSDFDKYVHDCIRLLIDHIGDPNIKLKERLENTLLEFGNYSIIGNRILFEHIISGQVKKNLINSKNHLSGRYNFLHRLIQNFGYNENEVPLETIMTYAIKGYTNPQVAVRDAALNLIVILYKFAGDKIRPFYANLRPAQINNIEDNIAQNDELNDNINNGNNEQYNNDIEPGDYVYDDNNINNNENDEMVNNSQMLSKEQQNDYNMNNDDTEHTCQFCGLFNPNFTSEQIDLHQFRECPMLIPCFKCKQIVEISSLNHHFLNECAQKKQFKQCPRCKEAVLIKDYEAHVADKSCNPFKSSNVCNRCPLCHNDITPNGKVGWEIHLMEQMCPNNPRTNS
jgi:centrosomal protein CEP104